MRCNANANAYTNVSTNLTSSSQNLLKESWVVQVIAVHLRHAICISYGLSKDASHTAPRPAICDDYLRRVKALSVCTSVVYS